MPLMTTGPVHAWIGFQTNPQQYSRSSQTTQNKTSLATDYPTVSFSNTFVAPTLTLPASLAGALSNPGSAITNLIAGGLQALYSLTAQNNSQDESNAQASTAQTPQATSSQVPVAPTILYLGTGEDPPEIKIRPHYRNVFNVDIGREVAYDKAYLGRDAIVSMTLTNWNEATYRVLAERTNSRAINSTPRGTDSVDAIGTLLVSEGIAVTLWLQFPEPQSGDKQNGLPDGYRFVCAYPLEETIMPGTRTNRLRLIWHAMKLYSSMSRQDQILFDHDMSALPFLLDVYGQKVGLKNLPKFPATK